jgi:glyoxylase-like metal-dependent hydrolase (beta-lactamase superfamily II)
MSGCRLERASDHVWWFTPDDASDRPALAVVAGAKASVLLEVGASPAHTGAFLRALEPLGLPPLRCAVLTHWHWDHSFGGAALDVPIAAHRLTADALAREAALDFGDAALDARVARGEELAFCAEMMRIEMPDRSALRVVEPMLVFGDEGVDLQLGGTTCTVRRLGGDHAVDSCVMHVVEDGLLFLGDCLYPRLHAPTPHLTIAGVRGLADRVGAYGAGVAILGHGPQRLDAAGLERELAGLRAACDRVERLGDEALATAADADDRETIELLLAGRAYA